MDKIDLSKNLLRVYQSSNIRHRAFLIYIYIFENQVYTISKGVYTNVLKVLSGRRMSLQLIILTS